MRATVPQIRRAYRNLITKEHPDKGGDADKFAAIQRAYDVLSSEPKRKQYDTTGRAERTVDEELMEAFGGGAWRAWRAAAVGKKDSDRRRVTSPPPRRSCAGKFRDKLRVAEEERGNLNEAIAVRQGAEAQSHSGGFDAWLRSRGDVKVRAAGGYAARGAALPLSPQRRAQIFTGDDVAEEYGVNKSSYEAVVLPNIRAYQARLRHPCMRARLGRGAR